MSDPVLRQELSDIQAALVQNATDGLSKVTVGNQTVEAMSIDDQIKAANYIAAQAAASSAKFGLRHVKQILPGCG